jgi:hypothetical protein
MSLASTIPLIRTISEIYEGTSVRSEILFLDHNGLPVKPNTVTYLVYDKFTGIQRDSGTILHTQTSIYLDLTSSVNLLYNSNNRYEIAVLQVSFTYGINKHGTGSSEYRILKLPRSSSSSSSSSSNSRSI